MSSKLEKAIGRAFRAPRKRVRRLSKPERSAFPSARQRGCAGLKKKFYPHHLREMIDYDYAGGLPEDARQWLAAFTEEHYKGFRVKRETQVTKVEHLRAADAARKRTTRGEDVMAFRKHLEQERAVLPPASGDHALHVPSILEFALLAGAAGMQEHELRARNHTEDRMLDELDEQRAAGEIVRRRG